MLKVENNPSLDQELSLRTFSFQNPVPVKIRLSMNRGLNLCDALEVPNTFPYLEDLGELAMLELERPSLHRKARDMAYLCRGPARMTNLVHRPK